MPPMFLPSGMVAMARTFGPKPDVVLAERIDKFIKDNGGVLPDSLHITVTQGVGAIGPEDNRVWQDAFGRVLHTRAAAAVIEEGGVHAA